MSVDEAFSFNESEFIFLIQLEWVYCISKDKAIFSGDFMHVDEAFLLNKSG